MTDLAQRLVQHPVWWREGFGWRPGMVDTDGWTLADVSANGTALFANWRMLDGMLQPETQFGIAGRPLDIEHPATQGHMLAMLRRAAESLGLHPWQLPMVVHETRDLWSVRTHNDIGASCFYGRTVGEAIARALLWAFDRLVEQEAG